MLDDENVILQRDPSGSLAAVRSLPEQARFEPEIFGEASFGEIKNIVIAGMGGSALAADMIQVLAAQDIKLPLEVVKGYDLPGYVDNNSLVVVISHSGNTEETLSCYDQAKERGAILSAMSTGGQLISKAQSDGVLHAIVPGGAQPRMSTVYHLRALLKILQLFNTIGDRIYAEIGDSADWLAERIDEWSSAVPTEHNYAKQIAHKFAGKTGLFYGGQMTHTLAYKWKISWNETAKNVAFYNQYPEFSHNEFMGWTSHPTEKPFGVLDIKSDFERPRIAERMELTDRMLSGKRPKADSLQLVGDSLVRQFLWGLALADMASIYLAILNNVDPAPVALIEKFKQELS